jgi:hypothetical protein
MKKKKPKNCDCLLCKPLEGKNVHPLYGYDFDEVPVKECIRCNKPIGKNCYIEVKTLARFGTMLFEHKNCEYVA